MRLEDMKFPYIDGPNRVYFIKVLDFIKIGYTGSLKQRLSDIQICNPHEIEVLLTIPGDRDDEEYYHGLFENFRTRGEWFRADPEALKIIEEIRVEHKEAKAEYEARKDHESGLVTP